MQQLLSKGDLVVCPEGTTCSEPYLLQFSSLFTKLEQEVTLETSFSMFYANMATGFKWLDTFFVVLNLNPRYDVKFLEKVCTGLNGEQ